jgi:hypothetical protein
LSCRSTGKNLSEKAREFVGRRWRGKTITDVRITHLSLSLSSFLFLLCLPFSFYFILPKSNSSFFDLIGITKSFKKRNISLKREPTQKKMSVDFSSERVCYVHCSFCTTILAVSVPYASLFTLVTVRCGHCTNLLSLNIGVSLHQTSAPPIHQDLQPHRQHTTSLVTRKDCASSSRSTNNLSENIDREAPRMPPIRRMSLYLPLAFRT